MKVMNTKYFIKLLALNGCESFTYIPDLLYILTFEQLMLYCFWFITSWACIRFTHFKFFKSSTTVYVTMYSPQDNRSKLNILHFINNIAKSSKFIYFNCLSHFGLKYSLGIV